jgi:hypothetical protein
MPPVVPQYGSSLSASIRAVTAILVASTISDAYPVMCYSWRKSVPEPGSENESRTVIIGNRPRSSYSRR